MWSLVFLFKEIIYVIWIVVLKTTYDKIMIISANYKTAKPLFRNPRISCLKTK